MRSKTAKKTTQKGENSARRGISKASEREIRSPTRAKASESEENKSRLEISPRQFREILKWHGLTQSKFAKEMGVSKTMVSKYINGVAIPLSWRKKLIELMGDETYSYAFEKVKNGNLFYKPLDHGRGNG